MLCPNPGSAASYQFTLEYTLRSLGVLPGEIPGIVSHPHVTERHWQVSHLYSVEDIEYLLQPLTEPIACGISMIRFCTFSRYYGCA